MIDQTEATLQEVCSQVSSTESVMLLPWCVSMVVPLCYISEATTMAAHQDESISILSEPCSTMPEPEPEPEPHGSPVPCPSGVLTPPLAMPPLPVFAIPYIAFYGTPLLGHSFAGLTIPPKGKWYHSPSGSPNYLHIKRTCVTSPEGEVRSEHSPMQGDDHMPNPTPETMTDSWQ